MKKTLVYIAAAAAVLAACQKENKATILEKDTVTATFEISIPGQPATKAVTSDDQTKVGDGRAADNLVFAVFDEEGNELTNLRQGDWVNDIGDTTEEITFDNAETPATTVTVNLVRGKVYTFVCWAQNKEAVCYDFKDMKYIGIDYTKYNAANNDLRDAFYACVKTEKVTSDFTQSVTLNRPFAQINVGTTDFEAAKKAGLEIDDLYSTMTVDNAATVLETFTGKATAPVKVTFAYAHAVAPEYDLVIDKSLVKNEPKVDIQDKYGWLAMNHILVADGADNPVVEVTFEISEGEGENAVVLTKYTVPSVPVNRNYRTNIVGDLLTAEGTIDIIIDPVYIGEIVKDDVPGL